MTLFFNCYLYVFYFLFISLNASFYGVYAKARTLSTPTVTIPSSNSSSTSTSTSASSFYSYSCFSALLGCPRNCFSCVFTEHQVDRLQYVVDVSKKLRLHTTSSPPSSPTPFPRYHPFNPLHLSDSTRVSYFHFRYYNLYPITSPTTVLLLCVLFVSFPPSCASRIAGMILRVHYIFNFSLFPSQISPLWF